MDKSLSVPLERVRVQIHPCKQSIDKEAKFLICSFHTQTEQCLEVIARRVRQVQYLVEYINDRHGGHIVPFLDLFNTFGKEHDSHQTLYSKISEYLNDLIKSPHCHLDPKLYEFVFQQEVHFPELRRYDKVLMDAATMSRKYLNAIFTRKQYGEVHQQDRQMLRLYQDFKEFTQAYRTIRQLLTVCNTQQDCYEEVATVFREIRGGLAKGLPPVQYINKKTIVKMKKLEKLILQADEAYTRWEVLRETVRELQCNLNKGLHEDNPYYSEKLVQLKGWTKSLIVDFKTLIDRGKQIVSDFSKQVYDCRHRQAVWLEEQDQLRQAEEREEELMDPLQGKQFGVPGEQLQVQGSAESEPQEGHHLVSSVRKMSG